MRERWWIDHVTGPVRMLAALTFLIPLSLSYSAPPADKNNNSVVGEWTTKDEKTGSVITFIFTADGKHTGIFGNQVIQAAYTVDYSKTPVQLDLTKEGDKVPVQTIMEFLGKDHIRVQESRPGRPRPTAFDAQAFVLARKS